MQVSARKAEDKKRLEDYVAKVVAEWPPLTAEQTARIAGLLRPAGAYAAPATTRQESREVIAIREAEAALAKARANFTEALAGCHGCGLSPKVHNYQMDHGMGFHNFVALTPADAIAIAKLHGKKIAAAEKALEALRG
jgi:hypothetical protein